MLKVFAVALFLVTYLSAGGVVDERGTPQGLEQPRHSG